MENFVLVGKAKTVFRLLELKVSYEERLRHTKEKDGDNRKFGKRTD